MLEQSSGPLHVKGSHAPGQRSRVQFPYANIPPHLREDV